MRLRDIGLIILVFGLAILISDIILSDRTPYTIEHYDEIPEKIPSKEGIATFETIPRPHIIRILTKGEVDVDIIQTSYYGEKNTLFTGPVNNSITIPRNTTKPGVYIIKYTLDPGEKIRIELHYKERRNDIIPPSTLMITAGAITYITLTILNRKTETDWI